MLHHRHTVEEILAKLRKETRRKACGPIPSRCRRWSGGREADTACPKTNLSDNESQSAKGNPEAESMKSRTQTNSYSPVLHPCIVNLLGATRALVSICVGVVWCGPVLDASVRRS